MKICSSGIFALLCASVVAVHAQTLEFNAGVYTVNEGAGTVTLTVVKSGTASGPVTVHYATSNNPSDPEAAKAGTDYGATSGDLTFAANESTKQFSVPIIEDSVYEGLEYFSVALSNPTGAALRDPSMAQVNITDNDPAPSIQFGSANYSVNENAGAVTLTITKTGATERGVSVYYKTRDGTAKAPSDYTFTGDDLSASVIFQPAETTKTIQIPIHDDGFMEPSETFEVYFTVLFDGAPGTPATATVTILDDDPQGPLPPARALNIATRALVQKGDRVMIAGLIVTGNDSKAVILRALGPSLAQVGISPVQVLVDPVLQLRGSNGSLIFENDNWKDSPSQRHEIEGTIYEPKDDREAAMVATLQPGAYTAIVTGKNQPAGIALVEAYDINANTDCEFANISTRGYVGIENDVMIGGFTLGTNPGSVRIALRGVGPSLANAGLSEVLADPTLELHDANGATLVANDNWKDDPTSSALLTANGLGLGNPKESGIFTSLPAGQFTAILAGKNGGIGIGLIEVYNLK